MRLAVLPGGLIHQHLQCSLHRIQSDQITIAHLGQGTTGDGFGAHMNGRRYLARCTAHAAIGDQGHAMALALQHRQGRGQLVQFGHAVGLRPLEPHHRHEVALEFTGLEGALQVLLAVEHEGRGLHDMAVLRHGRHLDHGTAQAPLQKAQPTGGRMRVVRRPEHRRVGAGLRDRSRQFAPGQDTIAPLGHLRVGLQPPWRDRQHIAVHQAGVQQFADHIGRPTRRLELVHIGCPIRVHARQQGHDGRQFIEVAPVDHDAGRTGHGHPVDEVVGGAAGGQQRHHRIDDAALVHHATDWRMPRLAGARLQHGAHRRLRECGAQVVVRVHEGRARHMQAHGLQQHLVAVGRAVEGAGARAMVGGRFRLEQLVPAHQPLRGLLADLGLVAVAQARAHGTGRNEDRRQMPEVQRADQQARHDLVAHAQQQHAVEHIMAERHGRGPGNRVAREQAQLHPWLALGDPIAHGRHTTGHLQRGPAGAGSLAQGLRVAFVGLMGRQHVVVGSDHGQVRCLFRHHAELVRPRQGRKGMRHIGAAHAVSPSRACGHSVTQGQVGAAGVGAAPHDAFGDRLQHGVQALRHGVRLNRAHGLGIRGKAAADDVTNSSIIV